MFLYLNGFRNKFSTQCVGGMAFEEATIAAGFKDANDAGGPYTPSIMVRGQSFLYRDGTNVGFYRENGGGIYTNADTSVSGFRLIGANSDHTIGTGSSNGWLSVWRFKRRV